MKKIIKERKLFAMSCFSSIILCLSSGNVVSAEISNIDVNVNGFIRADYGNGDRYRESQGEDILGSSRSALAITSKYENIKGVFVIGAESLTIDNGTQDDNAALMQDAFVVFENLFNNFTLKAGAQPLLFGLKPNGYAFDHSLVESIEYGAAGAFAVSNQAGPSVITNFMFSEQVSLDLGVFDLDTAGTSAFDRDGSAITDNGFIQMRFKDLFDLGIYGVAGIESRYVADEDESN